MGQNYSDIIVNRIEEFRTKRGLSVRALSEMSDVKYTTLENILRKNTTNPQMQTIHKIALAFGMTFAEFADFPELNEFSFEENEDE